MQAPVVVGAKLSPPQVSGAVVRRDQLRAIAAGAAGRVLYVRAPAGSGKTTLLATAAQRLKWRVVWYRLDALDDDAAGFVIALAAAIRSVEPGFGRGLEARLAAGVEPSEWRLLAAAFLADLGAILGDDTYVVLDDYQAVAANGAVTAALDLLIADLPPRVHFVLSGRGAPAFQTAKLRLAGECVVLGPGTVRFTADQVATLLAKRGVADAPHSFVARLLELSDGWAVAVDLMATACAASSRDAVDGVLDEPAVRRDVYDYLGEEVVGRLSAGDRAFLEKTCCLECVDASTAAALTGDPQAAAVLERLARDGVFTAADDVGVTYRYHELLRGCLADLVRRRAGEAGLDALRLASASALLDAGQTEVAIGLYLAAGDLQRPLEILRVSRAELLRRCDVPLLQAWARALAGAGEGLEPWRALLEAQVALRRGRTDKADVVAREAYEQFQRIGDHDGTYLSTATLIQLAFWRCDYDVAIALGHEALALAADDREALGILRGVVFAAVYGLRWDEARWGRERAEERGLSRHHLELALLRGSQATQAALAGNLDEALERTRVALDLFEDEAPASGQAGFMAMSAGVYAQAAEYAAAEALLGKAIELCEVHDLVAERVNVDDSLGFLLGARGRRDEALALLAGCLASPVAESDAQLRVTVGMHMGTILRRAGDARAALAHYELALASAAAAGGGYEVVNARLGHAYAAGLADPGRAAESREELAGLGRDAARRGLRFAAEKAHCLGALLPAAADVEAADLDALSAAFRALLALGHRNFIAQEVCAAPAVTARYLAWETDADALAGVLGAAALHPAGAAVLVTAVGVGGDAALVALEAGRGLDGRAYARLLERARRHREAEVRRRAGRLRDAAGIAAPEGASRFPELTMREAEILELVAEGRRNEEIAADLFVSPATVKTHVHRILVKLGVGDRVQAAHAYRSRLGG